LQSLPGIGRAVAEEMLSLGATVLVVSRSDEDVNQTVKTLGAQYGEARVVGVSCDISTKEGREKLMKEIQLRWGAVSGGLHLADSCLWLLF